MAVPRTSTLIPLDRVSRAIRLTAALVGPTWRHHIAGPAELTGRERAIYCFWHEYLLPGFRYFRGDGMAAVISPSRDGTRLSAVLQRWGYRVIRGSSSRRGLSSLRESIRVLDEGGWVVITPDGPRGPRRRMKPGVARLAAATGAVVVPVAIDVSPCVRLRSWDRFAVPLPFARVRLRTAGALAAPRGGLDEGGEPAFLDRIARALNG